MKFFWRLFPWLALLLHGRLIWLLVVLWHLFVCILFLALPIKRFLFDSWVFSRWVPVRRFPIWYLIYFMILLLFWTLLYLMRKKAISLLLDMNVTVYSIRLIHMIIISFFVFLFSLYGLSKSLLTFSMFWFHNITEIQFLTTTLREFKNSVPSMINIHWSSFPKIQTMKVWSELKNWWYGAGYYLSQREYVTTIRFEDETEIDVVIARSLESWNDFFNVIVLNSGNWDELSYTTLFGDESYWEWRTFYRSLLEDPYSWLIPLDDSDELPILWIE